MQDDAIYIELDDLAELREKAALLCEETKDLIEDYHRLRNWRTKLRPMTPTEAALPAATLSDKAATRPAELPHSSARSD
jgi:hypothetical protein